MQPSDRNLVMRLGGGDNVAVALRRLPPGTRLDALGLVLADEIPMGHKVALCPIGEGSKIIKFGVPIGSATREIAPGELVHVHNIKSDYVVNDVDHFED